MKKIYLIDGNSFIYRMFFALPEFTTKSGIFVNALFGMAKFFVGQITKENPDYVCFIKDARGKNFRHEIYSDYKATRQKMPDNLVSQIGLIEEMIAKMGFKIIEISGYEADDVIGTLAKKLGEDSQNDIFILSGDKDLYSLTKENVKIYDTMKGKIFDYQEAKNKFEVNPELIIDYLAIVGDSSDNIPGIDGFGPKKAVELINTYGTIEDIYKNIENNDFILKGKTLEKLINSKEIAFLSKKLATIELNVEFEFDLEDYKFNKNNVLNDEIKTFFREYEFFSLIGEEENIELSSWEKVNIKPIIIEDTIKLDELLKNILNQKEIFVKLQTLDENIYSELVGISIGIENDFFYINYLNSELNFLDLKSFFEKILNSELKIIGYDLKNDIQIIKRFLKIEENKSTISVLNNQTALF